MAGSEELLCLVCEAGTWRSSRGYRMAGVEMPAECFSPMALPYCANSTSIGRGVTQQGSRMPWKMCCTGFRDPLPYSQEDSLDKQPLNLSFLSFPSPHFKVEPRASCKISRILMFPQHMHSQSSCFSYLCHLTAGITDMFDTQGLAKLSSLTFRFLCSPGIP